MKRQILIGSLILLFASAFAIADDLPYKSGELLVRFANPAASIQTKTNILNTAFSCSCASVLKEYSIVPGLALVKLPTSTTVEQARISLAKSSDILYAEPDYKRGLCVIPNDPMFSQLWGMNNTGQSGGTPGADIDAPEAWNLLTGSSNVIVAVTDTGVDYTHPDLAANIWTDSNGSHGYDFVNDDNDPMDDHGHGTHVSGTIGAVGNNSIGVAGVCWHVRIMAVKIADANGLIYDDTATEGIQYAISKGAKVINASWGGGGYNQGLYDVISSARDANILFVAAAGNSASNNDALPFYPSGYNLDNIISVLATTDTDSKAGFSNYGLTSVDIGAPGANIFSTLPSSSYGYLSGTSMAAPHVSGACALLLSADASLTCTEVKKMLLDKSDPLPSLSGLCVSGGRLNLFNALNEVAHDTTPPSPDPAEWEIEPQATGVHTIAMQAKSATDRSGVEYFFECVTDANFNSGWQSSSQYVHGDPNGGYAAGTTYTFKVKYRDKSENHNETGWSAEKSTTTASTSDNLPPCPNPARWKIKPRVLQHYTPPRISMEAVASTDEHGPVKYYFKCVDVNGAGPNPSYDSGWTTSATYTTTSGPKGPYTFTVQAMDSNSNKTTDPNSSMATATVGNVQNVLTVPAPYHTIQAAVNAAVNGDIVVVRPFTYTGYGNYNIDFKGKAIVVRSMDPNDPNTVAATVINCQGWGRAFIFHGGEDHNSIVSGFTIINGSPIHYPFIPAGFCTNGADARGGAIACFSGGSPLRPSEPTITRCIIRDCVAAGQYGGYGINGGSGGQGANGNPGNAGGGSGGNGDSGGRGGDGCDGGNGGSAYGGALYFGSGSPEILQCRIIGCRAIGGDAGTGGNGGRGGNGGNGGDGGSGNQASPNGGSGGWGGNGGRGGDGGNGGDGGEALGGAIYFSAACQPKIVDCEIADCNTINGIGADAGDANAGGNGGNGGNGGSAGGGGVRGSGGGGGNGGNGGDGGYAGVDGQRSWAGAIYYENHCQVTIVNTTIRDNMLLINNGGFHYDGNGGRGGNGGNGGSGLVPGAPGSPGSDGSGLDISYIVNVTTLRGGGDYYEYDSVADITACTISGNNAVGQNYFNVVGLGGGEYYEVNCNSVFYYCRLEDNTAGVDGGGIYFNSGGASAFNFCDVNGNAASSGAGGGISGGDVEGASLGFTVDVCDSNFSANNALFGGGIYLEETLLTIEDSNFSGNTAFEGAGVWDYNCTATVKNCTVKNNSASLGGGFSFINGLATISNSVMTGNSADASFYGTGGALFFEGWSDYPHQVTNCLITDNTAYAYGGGLSDNRGAWVQITNCTFAGNEVIGSGSVGGGVSCAEHLALVDIFNSILWGNEAIGGGSQIAVGNPYGSDPYPYPYGLYADVTVSYSDVQGGEKGVWLEDGTQTYTTLWWLGGNINEDPLFATTKAAEQTYFLSQVAAGQLEPNSPCVDVGYGDACDLESIINMPLTTRTDLVADSCTVDMGYHYEAGLVVPKYRLTIEVINQGYGAFGTVLPPWAPGTYDVNQGRVVELHAVPDPNWEVYQWTGTDYVPVYPGDPNYNKVTMNSDKTVTVEFEPYGGYKKLVTHVIGNGTIEPPGLTIWPPGTVVSLTAMPANPSEVVIWTGTDDDFSDSRHNTVTMNAHKEVFAEFYAPRTLYVPADYPTIQVAIDDASDRDVIEISAAAEPYYTQSGFRIEGKAITITSTNPDDPCCVANTVIQTNYNSPASGVGPIFFFNNVGHNTILNGLTIRGYSAGGFTSVSGTTCGQAGGDGGSISGGGISCGYVDSPFYGNASPTIKNCIIADCSILGDNGGNGFGGCLEHPAGGEGGWPGRAYGAALACFNGSSPVVINCTFRNNVATGGNGGDGGTGNATPPGPWGPGGPGGGWYYGVGSRWYNHDWPNGPYDLYTEYTGRGGAVYVDQGCSPVFVDCTFTNNRSFGGTNGICGLDGAPANSRYEPSIHYKIDNFGGAVYVAGASTSQFVGCEFNNNLADTNNLPASSDLFVSYGGAIAFEDGADLTIEDCTFNGNLATIGGGIYSSHSDPLVDDGSFVDNSALHGGGALFVGGTVNITRSNFGGNEATATAGEGGGICCLGAKTGIVDCNIANNNTNGSGGGIYISSKDVNGEDVAGENAVLFKNCLITGNFASRDGGGISANWYSEPNIINCTIADNVVTGTGFEAGYGGGVYCSYNSYVNIINSIIWYNSGNIGVQGSQLAVATGFTHDPRPSTGNVTYSDIQDANDPNAFGAKIKALDLVFCIDTTGSMSDDINAVKTAANQITGAIVTKIPDSRIAVVAYKDFNQTPYGDDTDYPYRTVLGFTTNTSEVVTAINSLIVSGGGDTPEAVYTALMECIDHNSLAGRLGGGLYGASPASLGPGTWRPGNVMRVIILMGDAQPHDPEPFTNYTLEDVVVAADGVRPKRIVSLLVGGDANAAGYFGSLASETGGTVLQAAGAGQVVEALMGAIDLISRIPDPIFVDANCVLNWDPNSHSWDPNSHNINKDPCFVAGYYLSQVLAGQKANSPCVDSGSADANNPNISLDTYTTRTDSVNDVNIVDMGYHYRLFIAPRYRLISTAIAVSGVAPADQPVVDPNGGLYYQHAVVRLTVSHPPSGYQVLWTGTDDDTLTSTENTVLMDRDKTVTVTFVRNVCELTTAVIGLGGTVMPAGGIYPRGTDVNLTASPGEGYRVKRWTGTDNDTSYSATNTVTMNGDKYVTVEFDTPQVLTVPGDYTDIQSAIGAARQYDVVEVSSGVYHGRAIYIDKEITVTSTNPDDPCVVAATVIDSSGYADQVVVFLPGADANTVLNGFTLTSGPWFIINSQNATTAGQNGPDGRGVEGGAVYCYSYSSPTIKNCIIRDSNITGGNAGNAGDADATTPAGRGGWAGGSYGGGIFIASDASPTLVNCTITNCIVRGGNAGNGGNSSGTYPTADYRDANHGGSWSNDETFPWQSLVASNGQPYANDYWYYSGLGGGVFCDSNSSPTFIACNITNNTALGGMSGIGGNRPWTRPDPVTAYRIPSYGGGVYCAANSNVSFIDCNITGNTAPRPDETYHINPYLGHGGGIAFEQTANIEFINCNITDNNAAVGGGMYWISGDPKVIDCNIAGNTAYVGGGIYGTESTGLIQGCIVHGNFAGVSQNDVDTNAIGQGGGIYSASMESAIVDCTIINNEAAASGGGIFFSGVEAGTPTVTNCLVVDNRAGRDGGGLSVNWYATPLITNCTIVGNEATGEFGEPGKTGLGGGIYSSYHSYSVILNSILWNNYALLQGKELAVGTGFEYDPRPSTVNVSYSDVEGGQPYVFVDNGCTLIWGAGNIYDNPLFVAGYYLSHTAAGQLVNSSAIDAGSGLASEIGLGTYTTRVDGVPDAPSSRVDMGYHYRRGVTPYTLTIEAGPGGTVAWPWSPNTYTVPSNTVVNLEAVPDEGYRVKRWTGTDNDTSYSATNTVTMNGDKYVTVEFDTPQVLTVPGNYTDIQSAIGAARLYDIVKVASGVYQGGLIYVDKEITVTSTNPDDPCVVAATIIDSNGYASPALAFLPGATQNTVFDGFTIRGGTYNPIDAQDTNGPGQNGFDGYSIGGGAVYVFNGTSPTIKNCVIRDTNITGGNASNGSDADTTVPAAGRGGWAGGSYGGGIFIASDASPTLVNCTITNCMVRGGNAGNGGNSSGTYPTADYRDANHGGSWSNDETYPWQSLVASNGQPYVGDYWYYSGLGGGVFCDSNSSPTFIACNITNNTALGGMSGIGGTRPFVIPDPVVAYRIPSFGGGVFCANDCNVIFIDCNIAGNTAPRPDDTYHLDPYLGHGGGIAFEQTANIEFINCNITDNNAAVGGGMYWISGAPKVIDCNIAGNTAYVGGGIYGTESTGLIQGCIVHGNFAGVSQNDVDTNAIGQGGGIYSASMESAIVDCTIINNEAAASGGGIFFSGVEASTPTVKNCLVVGNLAGRDGGGLSVNWYAAPLITNCTIVGNEATGDFGEPGKTGFGGGIYSSYHSYSVILNSILWNNYALLQGKELAVGTGFEYDPRPSTVNVSYSDVEGGQPYVFIDNGCTLIWGAGNIQVDPCFVTGPLGTYYLSQTDTNDPNQTTDSPCVDAGNDQASNVGLSHPYTTRTDEVFDTNVVDMGYHYSLAHPIELCSYCDLSHNGDVNAVDFAIFSLYWLDGGCSNDNNWCSGADLTFDSHVNFEDLALLSECWLAEDTDAPLPSPSEWKITPHSTTTTPPYTVSMTAEPAFDSWGGVVEYYFECATGCDSNSGWSPNTTYISTNLDPNTAYGYRVKARDARGHETQWSAVDYAVTGQEQQQVDHIPPTPDPMTWASVPTATGSSTITMTATTAIDATSPPVQYYFECTSNGSKSSGWRSSPTYVATGLTPSTLYTFMVKARDSAIPPNETGWSDPASATTNAGTPVNLPPAPVAWATTTPTPPYQTIVGGVAYANMSAQVATDPEGAGVQYWFECADHPDIFNSGWINVPEWVVYIGPPGQGLEFHFKVRDTSVDLVESAWSTTRPCYPP